MLNSNSSWFLANQPRRVQCAAKLPAGEVVRTKFKVQGNWKFITAPEKRENRIRRAKDYQEEFIIFKYFAGINKVSLMFKLKLISLSQLA